MSSRLRILALEPWYQGSHRAAIDGLARTSTHDIQILALPVMGWRKAMSQGPTLFAATIAEYVGQHGRPDLLLASSPIDLAAVLGLARRVLGDVPVVLYQHESQLLFPAGPEGGRDQRAELIDVRSLATADAWITASSFHRDALLEELPTLLSEAMPDTSPEFVDRLADRHVLLPIGVTAPSPEVRADGPHPCDDGPLIVWNHRWEHDKNPTEFVHAALVLAAAGLPFRLALLGTSARSGDRQRTKLISHLGDRVVQAGALDRIDYEAVLRQSDIVVSTAHHEFFGLATLEALTARCWPVLPDRLSYRELVPAEMHERHLYGDGQFVEALRSAIDAYMKGARVDPAIPRFVDQFTWPRLRDRYDALFTSVHDRFPRAARSQGDDSR
ncbi:MAG: tRNA-queuosine alpha-mannosyltransferase domain-containing protein [Acidimicrobiales bacterium]